MDGLRYDSEEPIKRWFGYGWRGGAKLAFGGTVFTLVINVVLMVYLTTAFKKMDGFPVVYRGTCENAERQNTIYHFLINVLSTGLLAASNYCMQLLCAPTRANIDRAHATGHWLDIGIPSIRNLRFVHWKRRGLWLLLAISSIPLHLVYNSTFYAAIANNDYNILYATQDFVDGGNYDRSKFPDSSAQNISSFQDLARNWTTLNNHDCIDSYAHDFVTRYRNVIAVVSNVTADQDDTLLDVTVNELPASGRLDKTYDSFAWICNDTATSGKTGVTDRNSAGFVPCASMATELANIGNTWWKSGGYQISHCVAEEITPDCHLHFAPHLMGPVILMNIIKVLVAFYVAFRMVDVPLVTLGDAIESFIKHPDPSTNGMCLITAYDAARTFSKSTGLGAGTGAMPKPYTNARHRWHKVITRRQWTVLAFLLTIMIALLIVGIILGTSRLAPPTLANAWSVGVGEVQTQNLVLGARVPQLGASAVLITALIANAPQSFLSFLYMVYNTFFTLMHVGEDWDLYGAYTETTRHIFQVSAKKATHRYLRVSNPKGKQKSTHTLNLPLRFALPLVCVSGLLHWLMSQSLYLANISVIPRDGTLPRHDEITTVAYSPQGMILLCALAIVMFLIVGAYASRRYGGQMSIVGSNSAAIAAACHVGNQSERRRREIVLRKIAWGELPASDVNGEDRRSSVGQGLGIGTVGQRKIGDNSVYATEDFSDAMDRDELGDDDVENGAYHALRGHAEMTELDRTGVAKSSGIGHCSFSDGFVLKPVIGKMYA